LDALALLERRAASSLYVHRALRVARRGIATGVLLWLRASPVAPGRV
jgi:hypothetical protein